MTKETLHQRCVRIWEIYRPRKYKSTRHLSAAMRDTVQRAMSDYEQYPKRNRDWRGWNRDGSRVGPGSGRTADWLDIGYEHYCVTARAVSAMGYRDRDVSRITRVLRTAHGRSLDDSPYDELYMTPCLEEPVYWHRGYGEEFDRCMATGNLNMYRWQLWARWNLARISAEYDGQQRLAKIAGDPQYRISGYLAESILAYQDVPGHSGYEGCSGCESYAWHREHPEHWELLLSRAPVGASTPDAEQVYPHEIERRERLRAAGWFETLRMNDSVWTKKLPFAAGA